MGTLACIINFNSSCYANRCQRNPVAQLLFSFINHAIFFWDDNFLTIFEQRLSIQKKNLSRLHDNSLVIEHITSFAFDCVQHVTWHLIITCADWENKQNGKKHLGDGIIFLSGGGYQFVHYKEIVAFPRKLF